MQVSPVTQELQFEIERATAAVSARANGWYGKKLKGKTDDLALLQRMADDGHIGTTHIHEVLEVGLVLGALLAKTHGWKWVIVESEDGERQLRLQPRPAAAGAEPELVDPLEIVLDPVEAGRPIRIRELFDSVVARFPKR